jgi:peptidoglycan/xylan/chitin deacetylase (PgdA/CDA1 family)
MTYITTYQELKKRKSFRIRSVLRDVALTGLSFQTKLPNAEAVFQNPRVEILVLHHVFNDEIEQFDDLLQKLSQDHTFISYGEAVDRILSAKIDKPYMAISFDDGFKNNLNASNVLGRYDIKACFFVNPDSIGLKDYDKIKEFCQTRLHFPPTEFLDWSDVDELLKQGHEIGSHSISHINMAESNINEVEDNLLKSFEIIQANCGTSDHFAFPYGQFFHFNRPVFDSVFKAGYKSCASGERGCHFSSRRMAAEDLLVRRDQVSCDWKMNHIMYFMFNSSRNCKEQNNYFPSVHH